MTNFEKLQRLLEELFQLDQADLDFGIYRIMNQKRDEVVRFLEKDLLPQVKAAFGQYKSADKAEVQNELDKAIEQAKALGVDPDSSTKVRELREQYDDSAVDVVGLENEVFSHLFNFFRRYYHEGDFLSLRRYKEGVYAIPYEGEEVKLHWANHDQYYIKLSEYLRDYTFKLSADAKVHFRLVSATAEQDNKKETAGKERRFQYVGLGEVLTTNDTNDTNKNQDSDRSGEVVLEFHYLPSVEKLNQAKLNEQSAAKIIEDLTQQSKSTAAASSLFVSFVLFVVNSLSSFAPTKANPTRSLLEKHLTQYTARNTFDYFIHKDLGGFLRRELDFYVKNEVMHLDDIEHDTMPRVEQYLSKIKVIRRIAHKIIQFVEQLENFQKKLWLKKKFVIETYYGVTLDRIPEELYPEIAANEAQREEWVKLFAIDEIKDDLHDVGYSVPLTVEFLNANVTLVLNTVFFNNDLTSRILAKFEDIDGTLNGLLVHGEYSHALGILENRFHRSVKCVYSDPPYNTGQDGFPYRDTYQHSCWLSMICTRLSSARKLMRPDALSFLSTDDNEATYIAPLLSMIFGEENRVETIVWKKSYGGGAKAKHVVNLHEYIWTYAQSLVDLPLLELRPDESVVKRYYKFEDSKVEIRGPYRLQPLATTSMDVRPNLRYPILYKGEEVWPEKQWQWGKDRAYAALENDELVFTETANGISVNYKQYLKSSEGVTRGAKLYSIVDKIYTQQGTNEVRNILGELGEFSFPKPTALIKSLCECITDGSDIVLDFFAGSGTTGHAVIQLNREDKADRRYILVEMGEHAVTTIIPRLQRAVYSDVWKNGKPTLRNGVSHAFKYIRLESYEDALNNLELRRTAGQASLLEDDDHLREQFILSYMLDVESRGSQSLLNLDSIRKPDAYQLKVERNGETQLQNVDLVETFNWLLGLTVRHIDVIRGVRTVEGTNPAGDRVLVIWRDLDETDNDALGAWFAKQGYNTKDQEYDLLYVNGDNHLENLRRPDQTWKVRLIEEEFGRLMFDTEDQ